MSRYTCVTVIVFFLLSCWMALTACKTFDGYLPDDSFFCFLPDSQYDSIDVTYVSYLSTRVNSCNPFTTLNPTPNTAVMPAHWAGFSPKFGDSPISDKRLSILNQLFATFFKVSSATGEATSFTLLLRCSIRILWNISAL